MPLNGPDNPKIVLFGGSAPHPKYYGVQCVVSGEANPKNCLFLLGLRHPNGGRPSHGDRQRAQKFGKDRACGSGDMLADKQTHRQTSTHTQTCLLQYFATAPAGEVTTNNKETINGVVDMYLFKLTSMCQ